MPIYTKKGDKGKTSTLNLKDISKSDLQIEILGTIDEVNSFLGISTSYLKEKYLVNKITQVQETLFKLGSVIAGAHRTIPGSVTSKYEKEIDEWTGMMPPLKNFVFPGGSSASASLFTARAVVRRLERRIVKFNQKNNLDPTILVYINRLSDYLFTLARYINFRQGISEKYWS